MSDQIHPGNRRGTIVERLLDGISAPRASLAFSIEKEKCLAVDLGYRAFYRDKAAKQGTPPERAPQSLYCRVIRLKGDDGAILAPEAQRILANVGSDVDKDSAAQPSDFHDLRFRWLHIILNSGRGIIHFVVGKAACSLSKISSAR